jgi:hypothetical protein
MGLSDAFVEPVDLGLHRVQLRSAASFLANNSSPAKFIECE